MIALDTNVASELMNGEPNPRVSAWFLQQPRHTLYVPSVVMGELLHGVAILPEGKRKESLSRTVEEWLQKFEGRILPLDGGAARCYAVLAAKARSRWVRTMPTLPPSRRRAVLPSPRATCARFRRRGWKSSTRGNSGAQTT